MFPIADNMRFSPEPLLTIQASPMTLLDDTQHDYYSETFSALDLSSRELSAKEFDCCTFKECDLSDTVLSRCKFVDCDFINCNLSVTKIDYSKFSDVSFDNCKVIGVDWTKADWPNLALASPVKFKQCIINDSSFFGLSLAEITIADCKAHSVDFREANFSEADFTYTDLSHSLFNNSNLAGANFTEASNYDIDIYNNIIKGATFSRHEAVGLLSSLEIELVD